MARGGVLRRLTGGLTTLAYLAGWRLVRLLPERQAHALFRRIADVMVLARRQERRAAALQPAARAT